MNNLPILTQNTLLGLSEGGGLLYLDLLDKHQGWNNVQNEHKAFFEAHNYDSKVGCVFDHIIDNYDSFSNISKDIKTSMKSFMKDRWKNNFMDKK